MGQWVHSCELGLEEPSGGVGMGGILIFVVECKVLECGWVVVGCGLCSVEVQNLVLELVYLLGSWFWNSIILKRVRSF